MWNNVNLVSKIIIVFLKKVIFIYENVQYVINTIFHIEFKKEYFKEKKSWDFLMGQQLQ